jgi:hypothetical protein
MEAGSKVHARRLTPLALVAVISLIGAGVVLAAVPAIQTITPHKADQVTNIDVLRQQLKNYYGDPLAVTGSQASGTWNTHPLNLDSNYAHEAESVAADGAHWLAARGHSQRPSGIKAIVLDVDDTTLTTWNYEIFSNWDFNPSTNGTFVTEQRFPATPGMVEMVNDAAQMGYAVFFLTGRPLAQEPPTLGNLTHDGIGVDAGYPTPTTLNNGEDGLFTKPPVGSYPAYLDKPEFCEAAIDASASCPTIRYKSGVRAHIESLGYEIVANFGDQFSDLDGGFADKTFKLPNPNYFLP